MNDINLGVKAQSDFRNLIKDLNKVGKSVKDLNKDMAKLSTELKSISTVLNKTATSMQNVAAQEKKISDARKGSALAAKKVAHAETLVHQIYTKNSAVAQKKYLTSLIGLKQALITFREESRRVAVQQGKNITMLDEQSNSMKRFMIQGNLVSRTLDNMATKWQNMGKNMQWTGRQMMVGITMPLLGIGYSMMRFAKSTSEVDRQLKRVVEGGTKALEVLNQNAIELSNTWGVNVEQIKALQVQFAQAGFNTNQIKDLARQTQEFSVIGDVAVESAHSLVQALALTGKEGAALTETLAKLNLIDDETSLSMQDVADALPKIVPLFKQYGGTVEQAAALLAAFTDNSIDAVEGANTLKAVLTKVTPAMADASAGIGTRLRGLRDAIANVQNITGIDLNLVDQNGQLRTSLDILVQLGAAANELGKTVGGYQTLTVFSRELFGATQASRGTALLQELGQTLNDTTGNANGLAKAMEIASATGADLNKVLAEYERQKQVTLDDPWIKFQQTVQKLRNIAIDFGLNHVLPVASDLLEKLVSLIEKFEGLSKGTKDLIIKFALGAMALGPLIYGLGQFTIMASTLTKMVFTKPLKAIFHLGQAFKPLRAESVMAKQAIDELWDAYIRNDIDRDTFKASLEEAMIAEGRLRSEVDQTTAALARQADVAKASAAEMATAKGGVVASGAATAVAAAGPEYGPPLPMFTVDDLKKYHPAIYQKAAGEVAKELGKGALITEQGIDAILKRRISYKDKPLFPEAVGASKTKLGTIKNKIKDIDRMLRPSGQKLIVGEASSEFAHLQQAAQSASAHRKELVGFKKKWERYVPLLIEHTDITEDQLNDLNFFNQIVERIERDLPKNQHGAPISSRTNIAKVVKNRNIMGALGITDRFGGARVLRARLNDYMGNDLVQGARPENMLPNTLVKTWTNQYIDSLTNHIMETAAVDWDSMGANARKSLRSRIKSQASQYLSEMFRSYRLGADDALRSGADLLGNLGLSGGDVMDENAVMRIASKLEQGTRGKEMMVGGMVPQAMLEKIATNLYMGTDPGTIVTELYKELGMVQRLPNMTQLRERALQELTASGALAGFGDDEKAKKITTRARYYVSQAKKQNAAKRRQLAAVIASLSDEIMIMAGAEEEMVRKLREASSAQDLAGAGGEARGHKQSGYSTSESAVLDHTGVPDDWTFEQIADLGERERLYHTRLSQIERSIEQHGRRSTESMREYRSRVNRVTRNQVKKLMSEREKLVAEIADAQRTLDYYSRIQHPQGQLLLDGKPATQAQVDRERDRLRNDPRRGDAEARVQERGNELLRRRAPLVSRARQVAGAIDDAPIAAPMRSFSDRVKDIGTRSRDLIKSGGILNVKTWGGAAKGAKTAAKEVGVLGKGVKSLSGLTSAFTGISLVGQGGLTTLLKPALPLIGILTAVAGAFYLIYKNWDEVGPHVVDGLKAVKDAAKNVFDAFIGPFRQVFGIMGEAGTKGKEMSSTWQSVGIIINNSLRLVATVMNALAVVIRPIATMMAHLANALVGLLTLFSRLPSAIQLVIVAFGLMQLQSVRTAVAALVQGFINLIGALMGIPAKAAAAAAGLSMIQVAAAAAAIALIGISMGVQSLQQAQQAGIDTANAYWAAINQDYELGPQQALSDVEDAWKDAAAEFERANAEFEEQKKKQGGDGITGRIARTWGAMPLVSTKSDDERKKALEMEAHLATLQAKMQEMEAVYNRQTKTIRVLGREFGLTEKQIIEFAKANNIDLTRDTKKVLDKFREKWAEASTDINGNPIMPEIDTAQMQEAQQDLEKFYSTFRSQMDNVTRGWVDAAMDAFGDWAKKQIEGYDDQVEAINRLTKAEEEAQRKRDYLRRKEELALKRRDLQTNYTINRAKAIYEGRYDDAAMIDMDYQRDVANLDKEAQELEEDHQKEMTRIQREAEIERLNNLKEEKQKQLDVQRENLQKQLDAMIEFTPRNAAAAKAMQDSILAKLNEAAPGYGQAALASHDSWKQNWDSAWAKTKQIIAEDAYWAGRSALENFADGAGIDKASLGGATGPTITQTPGKNTAGNPVGGSGVHGPPVYHSGGNVGSLSGMPQDIPATLQTGEFVIQRKAVSKYGTGLLSALNEGQIFHSGGQVGLTGAASLAARKANKNAINSLMAGGKGFGGITMEALNNMWSAALGGGGYSLGDVSGKSVAEIVDTMISGIHPEFKKRLEMWNQELGGRFDISRGYRSMAQQQYLYDRWLRKVPGQAPAAPPGRSMHNFGLAVDLIPGTTSAAQRAAGAKYGLRWPMSYEPWHVEPVEAKQWRDMILQGVMPGAGGDTGGLKAIAGLFGATGGDAKSIVKSMLGQFGWGMDQWPSLEALIQGESSWNPNAANPTTSARGLFQKMTSIHGPIEPTVQGQAMWGLNYIKGRYGSPSAAYAKWLSRNPHWYHYGGLAQLKEGGHTLNDGIAKLHKKETVLTAPLSQELMEGIKNLGNNQGVQITLEIGNFVGSDREIEKLGRELERVMTKVNRAKGNQSRVYSS